MWSSRRDADYLQDMVEAMERIPSLLPRLKELLEGEKGSGGQV